MKELKLFFFAIALSFIYSCSTYKINFNRSKIINKYSKDYSILLYNEKIDIETFFIDKNNIKSVIINKKDKSIKISQIEKRDFFEIKKINLDSLSNGRRGWDKKKIELIVLNGIPLNDYLIEKIQIDPYSIKSIQIVTENTLNTKLGGRNFDGDLLLITTK